MIFSSSSVLGRENLLGSCFPGGSGSSWSQNVILIVGGSSFFLPSWELKSVCLLPFQWTMSSSSLCCSGLLLHCSERRPIRFTNSSGGNGTTRRDPAPPPPCSPSVTETHTVNCPERLRAGGNNCSVLGGGTVFWVVVFFSSTFSDRLREEYLIFQLHSSDVCGFTAVVGDTLHTDSPSAGI